MILKKNILDSEMDGEFYYGDDEEPEDDPFIPDPDESEDLSDDPPYSPDFDDEPEDVDNYD